MSTPAQQPARPELTDAAVVSRSWGMALATLVSRITGFVRVVLLAAILGAALSSAFSVANQLPNQIAALVLEATFTAIFVPVLARAERDDADGGAAFVRRLVTLATALLLATTVISVAAAPLLVRLMLGGDPQVNEPLTIAFAYLLLPQVICYGLSSVFMAILNTRNIFGAPAWAPVVNNVVAIATLVLYLLVPGELSVDPVRMGNAKLLVLGLGTTAGVVAQTAVLLVAIRRERISLRPLWGIDDRLKRFGTMASAMVLYVLISQVGLVVTNQIASTAAASGPAIYYYSWLLLQLPFGMIGVTVLTVVMPRLSRNAAAGDDPAVLADLSLATRLMMITLIPIVALMTVGGPAIGSALFAYGNFGNVDAGYLGAAVAMSAFTLIPYAMVLLQLRVFYAREQPWTPIAIIVVITAVKIAASVLAPHLTGTPELVAAYLGLANGLGFLAGAIVGHLLLRRSLRPVRGPGAPPARWALLGPEVIRTVLVTLTASLLAGLVVEVLDRALGLRGLTDHGAAGSMLRLLILTAVMLPIIAAVMVRAEVPEAVAAVAAVRRRMGAGGPPAGMPNPPSPDASVPYADSNRLPTVGGDVVNAPATHTPPAHIAGGWTPKGGEVANTPSEGVGPQAAARTVAPQPSQRAAEAPESAANDSLLTPGLSIAGGRYRLLVRHGGTPVLQFWQALDTALDRQVALTFVDPNQTLSDEQLTSVLSRTQRLSQIDLPGIARVLDVVRVGAGGLVVSEWVRGASLQEVAGTAPSPIGAARAIRSLASAAESAHHSGVALSIDHPARVRVSIEGDVTLAFPATLPDTKPEDDIRGIGATLYALLVNRWPLADAGADSGLKPADLDSSGNPVKPDSVNPDIPFQISAAASHAIQPDGGIRGASTLSNLLQQATALHEQTELLGPVSDEPPAPRVRPAPPDAEAAAERRRRVLIGLGIGAAVILVALLVLASVLNRIFGDVNGLDKTELGLSSPSASSLPGASGPNGIVKPVQVTVFSPGGEADRPQDAALAIDGNPATAWSTDTYSDPVPFPNFKNGVGLMLQLPKPTVIGTVSLNVSSTGTKVELRSSPTPKPARLEDTTLLAPAKALQPGSNKITADSSTATSNLLVWISTMGNTGGESRTQISEITVQAAS
ncbi:murein biosynthesis integral membrane protein MurJ [Mycolicibacter arupensis]|uniref:Membrane protein n=1 Tax=Mycolicibacter arupensis TaxID=342002 RepID=A0A0F5MUZ1_9MYCO|nr:murein biosynthesis integral membrane protein MurJ [Mycolicibacter arupensis]MCV7277756.1 murein biosynthesis integral membrane protein MurJ [Mycolicibacter arupensis]OQZ96115.1 murein biosynthesis integral membrane protein MurJ [Mycolicibacter arupensis]